MSRLLFVGQEEVSGEPVPLLSHTDVDVLVRGEGVDLGVGRYPIQLAVHLEGGVVTCDDIGRKLHQQSRV